MSVNQRLNFGFGRLHENQIQDSVSVILIVINSRKYKVCTFEIGIGILKVYLIGYSHFASSIVYK